MLSSLQRPCPAKPGPWGLSKPRGTTKMRSQLELLALRRICRRRSRLWDFQSTWVIENGIFTMVGFTQIIRPVGSYLGRDKQQKWMGHPFFKGNIYLLVDTKISTEKHASCCTPDCRWAGRFCGKAVAGDLRIKPGQQSLWISTWQVRGGWSLCRQPRTRQTVVVRPWQTAYKGKPANTEDRQCLMHMWRQSISEKSSSYWASKLCRQQIATNKSLPCKSVLYAWSENVFAGGIVKRALFILGGRLVGKNIRQESGELQPSHLFQTIAGNQQLNMSTQQD